MDEQVRITVPVVPAASRGSAQQHRAAVAPQVVTREGLGTGVRVTPAISTASGAWQWAGGNPSRALAMPGRGVHPGAGCVTRVGAHTLTSLRLYAPAIHRPDESEGLGGDFSIQ